MDGADGRGSGRGLRRAKNALELGLALSLLCSLSCSSGPDPEIGGVWAEECTKHDVGYFPGAFLVEPLGHGAYQVSDCRGKSCGRARRMSRRFAIPFWEVSYEVDGETLLLQELPLERCSRMDAPLSGSPVSDAAIRRIIVGRWRGSDVCTGMGCLGGEAYAFRESGTLARPSDMGAPASTNYRIAGGTIFVDDRLNDPKTPSPIRVLHMSTNYALVRLGKQERPKLLRRADVQIDEEWLTGRLGLQLNPRWGPVDPAWFDFEDPDAFESGPCSFQYFAADHRVIKLNTHACYRKRGGSVVRLQPEFRLGTGQFQLGRWALDSNQIVVGLEFVDVLGERVNDSSLGLRHYERIRMHQAYPETVDGHVTIEPGGAPEIRALFERILERHADRWTMSSPDEASSR